MVKIMIDTHAHLSMLDDHNARFSAQRNTPPTFPGVEALVSGLFASGFAAILNLPDL
ncbi:hypothetical protein AGMMS4952_18810 [Spirochaetia bacterium]|nr:hypothetical protein AGMMS4952_18810 [Spirochaetia bacterium]